MNIYIFLFNLFNKLFFFNIYFNNFMDKLNKKKTKNEVNQTMNYDLYEKKIYFFKNKKNSIKKKDNIYTIPDAKFISDDGPIMF